LDGSTNKYVLKIVNKSVYGFRFGATGISAIFYIADLTNAASTCQLVTFENNFILNFD